MQITVAEAAILDCNQNIVFSERTSGKRKGNQVGTSSHCGHRRSTSVFFFVVSRVESRGERQGREKMEGGYAGVQNDARGGSYSYLRKMQRNSPGSRFAPPNLLHWHQDFASRTLRKKVKKEKDGRLPFSLSLLLSRGALHLPRCIVGGSRSGMFHRARDKVGCVKLVLFQTFFVPEVKRCTCEAR